METNTIDEKKNQEILFHAEKLLRHNELLIKQCDSWLSAEEGNANMMKAIMEREKATRISRISKISRIFGIDRILSTLKRSKI